ncbi:DUF3048 domain-containing protein [Streptomyces sp. B1866]|uniref:DUF3048 domain-containing protein n=1 Tax=Streptomyces sp. B1866 TaxID=3075431 RepID=UPI0028910734|nr:DUF3048 domain-containing protein [Streptomyces sp. B1866]MDT3396882.1 DUF3048 domain-containing protein [Streptomyces sp. B1866]
MLAAALLLAAAGCQGGDGDGSSRPESPFTGEPAGRAPVLAVKVDNAAAARPPTGLDRADIVYAEQVEGGLSRLMAVYSAHLPPTAGPVRSARESDLELLRQFGRPALAYSGVQGRLQPAVDRAPLYPVTPGTAPRAYERSQDRAAPHNLYVRPAEALRAAPRASDAADIGFRFGAAPAGGRARTEQTVRYPAARFTFTWSGDGARWLVSMDGGPARTADGRRLAAATVVVQYVTVRPSRYHDRWGSVSPFTETVGSGRALVLRDGRAYDARWSRPGGGSGTAYRTPDGDRLPFARGPVWVVFAAR